MNGYTYGMDVFGKDEMEVLGTDAEPGDLRDIFWPALPPMCWRMIWNSTLGKPSVFAEDDKHAITAAPASACRKIR